MCVCVCVSYLLVPVGESHHDVERGQAEAEVEEGVAVGDPVLFVVHGTSDPALTVGGLVVCSQSLALLCLHQLVYLCVVGRTDAVEDKPRRLDRFFLGGGGGGV